jgi:hypothetical protein
MSNCNSQRASKQGGTSPRFVLSRACDASDKRDALYIHTSIHGMCILLAAGNKSRAAGQQQWPAGPHPTCFLELSFTGISTPASHPSPPPPGTRSSTQSGDPPRQINQTASCSAAARVARASELHGRGGRVLGKPSSRFLCGRARCCPRCDVQHARWPDQRDLLPFRDRARRTRSIPALGGQAGSLLGGQATQGDCSRTGACLPPIMIVVVGAHQKCDMT